MSASFAVISACIAATATVATATTATHRPLAPPKKN